MYSVDSTQSSSNTRATLFVNQKVACYDEVKLTGSFPLLHLDPYINRFVTDYSLLFLC